MQFHLVFELDQPLTLPISYHSTIQGFIYQLLNNSPEYSSFLHDHGYLDKNHSFKLFVFSLLQGEYKINMPNITFYHEVAIEIRSPLKEFCTVLFQSLMEQEFFVLANQKIRLKSCNTTNHQVTTDHLAIEMLSPVCLSTTFYDNEKKKTRFLAPTDSDFDEYLNHNLRAKYASMSQISRKGDVSLIPISCNPKDKYVTKFRNAIYITGWMGRYELSGPIPALQFLYDTGIGSRNSQGFGMFSIL